MKEIQTLNKKGQLITLNRFDLFIRKMKHFFEKWKVINTDHYWIVPNSKRGHHFVLTDKEYEDSEKIYKEKGTISYEFYPCAGIAFGVKIHVIKTDEIIDISDISNW